MPVLINPHRFGGGDTWNSAVIGNNPPASADHYFVRNVTTGQNYFEKDPDTVTSNNLFASCSKIVTAYIVAREVSLGVSLTDTITVVTDDLVGGTNSGLEDGDVVSVGDLFMDMLVASDNEAAYALARSMGDIIQTRTGGGSGGLTRFRTEANAALASFGATNSNWGCPAGISGTNPNTSTARDWARIVDAVFNDSTVQGWTTPSINEMTLTLNHDVVVSGGSNPRTIPIIHSSESLMLMVDPGLVALKGGALSNNYSNCRLWDMPSGDRLIFISLGSGIGTAKSGDSLLDYMGLYYEVLAQFNLGGTDSDASFSNVVLLTGGDSGFTDESTSAKTLTAVAATRTTTMPIVGSHSYEFNGTTAHIHTPDSDDWRFLTGDFCIDLWFRGSGTAPAGSMSLIGQWDSTTNQRSFLINYTFATALFGGFISTAGSDGTNVSSFHLGSNSIGEMSPDCVFNGAIRHLRLRRSSGVIAIYFMGIKAANLNLATANFNSSAKLVFGARQDNTSGITQPFAGMIDEVRIRKGDNGGATGSKFFPILRAWARS